MNVVKIIEIVMITFIFTALIVPVIKKIAFHIGAIDVPNERKVHTKEMPRLGGLAIFLGFLLGYILFAEQSLQMNSILIGSFIIILTGIIDDIKPLRVRYKFIGQLLAAIIAVFYGGFLLRDIGAFGVYINFGIFCYPLTIFFILGVINAINLIDGLDGLAAGVSSIYFLTISIIAFLLGTFTNFEIVLTLIMFGSTLGFLVHNFYPAKIFMGDTGSMFLGYIIAIIALLGFKNVTLTSFIVPLIILTIPALDTLFAIIRRIIRKQSITTPDKSHLHHQLLKLNFSHRTTVLIMYYIDALFSLVSIIYVTGNNKLGIIIYIILLVNYLKVHYH